MILSIITYLFCCGRKRKLYRHLSQRYNVSMYRVYAIGKGRPLSSARDYLIYCELHHTTTDG